MNDIDYFDSLDPYVIKQICEKLAAQSDYKTIGYLIRVSKKFKACREYLKIK
jgi:hypothetical protein